MSDTAPTMREVIARTDAEMSSKDTGAGESGKTEKSERVPHETSKSTIADTKTAIADSPATNVVDEDPLADWNEAPAWAKRWGKDSAKALRAFATDPNNGENWKHVGNELNKLYTDWGKQANEVGQLRQFRQQYEPINDLLRQANQQYTMQGMSLQQGLAQQMAVAQALASDPDSTLAWLASIYKPRDAGKFIQSIAQATGADLNAAVQSAPYVDPTVTQMVNPLLQRLQGLEQTLSYQQQQQVQQQQQYVLQHIQAFENAVDDNGQPKHPYLRDPEVFTLMLTAMNSGMVPRDLAAAYDWATARHLPAIQAKAKAAQEEALRKAATTTENSQQARQASNNLQGSAGKGRKAPPPNSIRDAIRATAKAKGETIPSSW